jgi:hypothetical protein
MLDTYSDGLDKEVRVSGHQGPQTRGASGGEGSRGGIVNPLGGINGRQRRHGKAYKS